MNPTRADIVQTARSYLGVKWKHMGRDREGLDCVGLLIAVWRDLGYEPSEVPIPPYRLQPDGTMLDYFKRYMVRCPLLSIREGTAVVFSYFGSPYHAGIVIDAKQRFIVHAFAQTRQVVVDDLDNGLHGRKLISAWDYPGV